MNGKIRIPECLLLAFRNEIEKYTPCETQAYLFGKKVEVDGWTLYLGQHLILPDKDEIERERFQVKPKDQVGGILMNMYGAVQCDDGDVVQIIFHSHPFAKDHVSLSAIDHLSAKRGADFFREQFGPNSEIVHVVFNRDASCFDGVSYTKDGLKKINLIVGTGNPPAVLLSAESDSIDGEIFSRVCLWPDYDLDKIAPIRVGIIGKGGIGAHAGRAVLTSGLGSLGGIVSVDPDRLEMSNLQRIFYAAPQDVGRHKTDVFADFADYIRPGQVIHGIAKDCFDSDTVLLLATCDVIILCVDSELCRDWINVLCASFLIPCLDLATQIYVDKNNGKLSSRAGGHARLFIPGETPCLKCSLGIDQNLVEAEIAKRTLTPVLQKMHEASGYMKNLTDMDLPEPSVDSLNAIVAGIGMAFLERYLIHGVENHHMRYTHTKFETFWGKSVSLETCPYCGPNSIRGTGILPDYDEYFNRDEMVEDVEPRINLDDNEDRK